MKCDRVLHLLIYALILLIGINSSFAQKHPNWKKNTVMVRPPGKILEFDVHRAKQRLFKQKDKSYRWYKANSLKSTYGDYAGVLLHGQFREYNDEKDLLVAGRYRKGLRVRTWLFWFDDGTLSRVEHYRFGRLCRSVEEYTTTGDLVEKVSYRNGQRHGKTYVFSDETIVAIETYRKGHLLERKVSDTVSSVEEENENDSIEESIAPGEERRRIRSLIKTRSDETIE